MIICLETATNLCSVALCDSTGTIALREDSESKSHASLLTVFIADILKEQAISVSDLDAVAVSSGPGSYTGLRIGVSAAKGIAFGSGKQLIAVETLESMFSGMREKSKLSPEELATTLWCPMIDARRMEVYCAIFDHLGNKVRETASETITAASFSDIPVTKKIIFFGNGAEKCNGVIERNNILFDSSFRMSAAHMAVPANKALLSRHFEDVAYFEPFYLKDFIVTKPRKNILLK